MSSSKVGKLPSQLPPLVFEPVYVEKIWGGRRLEKVLGKALPGKGNYGEAWEVFDFPPGTADTGGGKNKEWLSAVVAEGELKGVSLHQIMGEAREALLGAGKAGVGEGGEQFPLLVKFLDAREDLSIQVHPTPAYAKGNPGAHLKTECWVVMDHTKGAFLYKGLNEGVTREGLEKAIKEGGDVAGMFGKVAAMKGDCHFLPSGAVHALGAGVLVAEVQTPSDTTYRVFDFNRVDASTGKPRTLHVKEAMECINFDDRTLPAVTNTRNANVPLVDCEFFKLNTMKAAAHQLRPLAKVGGAGGVGQMQIWVILEGEIKFRWPGNVMSVKAGRTVVIPASVVGNLTATFVKNTMFLEAVLP